MIDGQQYLLCGRYTDREDAARAAEALRGDWEKVRVIKVALLDYRIFVHARK